jgi:hypothetical protein
VLVNDKVQSKFQNLLLQIRNNDPKLKDPENNIFNDSDFSIDEGDDPKKHSKSDKAFTYKDQLHQEAIQKFDKSDDEASDSDDNDTMFKKANKETKDEE